MTPLPIAVGDTPLQHGQSQSWTFTAPAIPPGQIAVLDFQARWSGASVTPGGSAYLLPVQINGQPVVALVDRVQPSRLRNKPAASGGLAWYQSQYGWRIVAAQDFPAAPDESFHFVIEIGQLLQPGANTLTISTSPMLAPGQTMTLRNVQIGSLPMQPAVPTWSVPAGTVASLQVSADGGVWIGAGSYGFHIGTSFSDPGGGWLRLGAASREPAAQGPPAPVAICRTATGQWAAVFETPFYRVERLIESFNGRLSVADSITNRTTADLGMMVRHELLLPQPAATVRLGGSDDPAALQTICATNPTVYVPLGGIGLGLVAEDEVLRNQGILLYNPATSTASIRTERLILPAGETVTLLWSAYALPGSDYFDLVNRIRADWAVKQTLQGPYWWSANETAPLHTDAELQAFVERCSPYAAVFGSWVDPSKKDRPPVVGLGAGVLDPYFASYRAGLAATAQRIKQLAPGLHVGVYGHFFFNCPQAGASEFQDSWIVGANGQPYVETFGGSEAPAQGVLPTTANSFGKAFVEMLASLVSDLGVDGFYFDETQGDGRLVDPITYGAWDRRSGILDPQTFAVVQKVGYLDLLTGWWKHYVVNVLQSAGHWLLGNDQPHSPAANADTWPRFTESDVWAACSNAHLYSPLAFTYYGESYTVQNLRDWLAHGVLCCVTGPKDALGITGHFFPITPTGLHQGWVEGEERVVTAVSGSYGWQGAYQARVWAWNADGSMVSSSPPWQATVGPVSVVVPTGGIAVLERGA